MKSKSFLVSIGMSGTEKNKKRGMCDGIEGTVAGRI